MGPTDAQKKGPVAKGLLKNKIQFSCSVMSNSLPGFHGHHQPWSLLKLRSIQSVMSSHHLILCHPLLLHLQSFLASGSFLVTSGGQSIGASASVLPINIQDWFPLGLTGLVSLQSKEPSRVFSNTTVQKHQFFGAEFYGSALTSIHDYWRNQSFDYRTRLL